MIPFYERPNFGSSGFDSDEPFECTYCGKEVYAGNDYYHFDGEDYCCAECVRDAIAEMYPDASDEEREEIFFNRAEIRYLKTAYDRQMEYEDDAYDRAVEREMMGDD